MLRNMKSLIITFALSLGFSFLIPLADKAEAAVYWNGAELKPGQLGQATILQNTSLFKLNGETKTFARTLKKGESYRIYAFKPGMLSLGGGYYLNRDNKVKYVTPSKSKLDQVKQDQLAKLLPTQFDTTDQPYNDPPFLGILEQAEQTGQLRLGTTDQYIYQTFGKPNQIYPVSTPDGTLICWSYRINYSYAGHTFQSFQSFFFNQKGTIVSWDQ